MPVWIFQEADARRESWGCVPVKEEPETEKEECDVGLTPVKREAREGGPRGRRLRPTAALRKSRPG